jgi:hypothetical protein
MENNDTFMIYLMGLLAFFFAMFIIFIGAIIGSIVY